MQLGFQQYQEVTFFITLIKDWDLYWMYEQEYSYSFKIKNGKET